MAKLVPCNFHILFGLIRVYTKILGVVRKDWWYSPILLVSANLQINNCTSLPRHLEFLWQRLKTLQQSSTSMQNPLIAFCWWRRLFHLRQLPSMNFESQLPKHLCWSPQSIPVEENKGKPGFTNCQPPGVSQNNLRKIDKYQTYITYRVKASVL